MEKEFMDWVDSEIKKRTEKYQKDLDRFVAELLLEYRKAMKLAEEKREVYKNEHQTR